MTYDVRNWSVSTPWLNPDWQWRKVCRIVATDGYATVRRDGELVQRMVRCVRQLERARTDRGVRRAALDFPDVYWALRLQQETSTRVLELKARVLAGQSDQAIASLLGLPTRTVTTFVAVFFDVRPRLRAGTWIRRIAIGLPLDQGPSLETLLLLHAWRRGPTVIEPWFDYLAHQEERHDLGTDLGRQRAWIECLTEVHQLPFEAQTLRSLFRLRRFIMAKSLDVIKPTTVRNTVLQTRERMLNEIAWNEPESQEREDSQNCRAGEEVFVASEEGKLVQAG